MREAGNYQILHLATHGYLDMEDPLYHKLVFASKDGKEDELYAYEICNMRLNSEMAVLSACNTADGQLKQGEGVMSLARAFTFAGIKSLITTQWQIFDKSSSEIMIGFYQELQDRKPKDIALKKAQLAYLRSQDENIYAHPYFWAAYVAVGDTKPLVQASNLVYVIIIFSGLLFLGIVAFFWTRSGKTGIEN